MAKKKKNIPKSVKKTDPQQQVQKELDSVMASAIQLHEQGNLQQAETLYKSIINVDPNNANAFHLLGVMAQQVGNNAQAVEVINHAIHLNSRVPEFHFNRGVALQSLQEYEEAVIAYEDAISLKPQYREAHENLGVALQEMDRYDEALGAYLKAISIDGRSLLAHQNAGTLYLDVGRFADAEDHFTRAIALKPGFAQAHLKKALALLGQGEFRRGWSHWEWRYFSHSFLENNKVYITPFPRWDGSSLEGKSIFIKGEQGIGDEIMYASCFQEIINLAETTVIECDPRLVQLFTSSFQDAIVIASDKEADFYYSKSLPHIDWRIEAGSLPRFLRQDHADFPREDSFLEVDPELKAYWRKKLSVQPKPLNIGISWRGGAVDRARATRSIPLEEWRPLFSAVNANFINLQYGQHEEEISNFNEIGDETLIDFAEIDPIKDLDNFSALISTLDLVIAIDNSTVHFSGAIGTETWVLLPCGAEWRWLKDISDCIWYKKLKLYRNPVPEHSGWQGVLTTVVTDAAYFCEKMKGAGESSSSTQWDSSLPTLHQVVDTKSVKEEVKSHSQGKHHTALLLNDTSFWYHYGCTCTSLAIHKQLREKYEKVISIPITSTHNLSLLPSSLQDFDDPSFHRKFFETYPELVTALQQADTVYINGEGTLHNVSAQAVGLLFLAYHAKKNLAKNVRIINHSCYPDDTVVVSNNEIFSLYQKVYKEIDYVAIREKVSAALLTRMTIPVHQTFDCLPLFITYYYESTVMPSTAETQKIVVAGSVSWGEETVLKMGQFIKKMHKDGFDVQVLFGANAYPAVDDTRFIEILSERFGDYFSLLHTTSESEWLQAIEEALLVVSGRFHHTIAAAFLNTPFIVMESNTPKITGLMQMLDLDTTVSLSEKNLAVTLHQEALEIVANPEKYTLDANTRAHLIELAKANFVEP